MRSFGWISATCISIFIWSSSPVDAKEAHPGWARDRAAIQWKLPHQFSDALKEAKSKNRILLIKGVSFGIDDAGAKCATDGMW